MVEPVSDNCSRRSRRRESSATDCCRSTISGLPAARVNQSASVSSPAEVRASSSNSNNEARPKRSRSCEYGCSRS